ncbi:MAG: methionyl-tRNA formyltransferase [Nitrospinales bacterium]
MKIIFMGTPDFAVPTLEKIHQSPHELLAVITQPDKPKGRGRTLQPSPVKSFAIKAGIKVLQPAKASAPETVAEISAMAPDLIIVAAYGQILRENFLSIPKHFCMNLHSSILPKYRGAAPINWAIINGDSETGVTTMKMDKGLDTGDILLIDKTDIKETDDAQTLHDTLANIGASLTLETINQLEKNSLTFIPQDDLQSTYAHKLKKTDGLIDWHQDAKTIRNRIRGLEPWPGAYTFYNGSRMRICKAEIADSMAEDQPGHIVRLSDHGIEMGTASERLIITDLQPEGKKRMSAKNFLMGHNLTVGERFENSIT